jgi:glycosyltransferase involved in cell wall biosynthesis
VRVAFCLAGLHRVNRGAEVAFESIARELARSGEYEVTLIGSGQPRDDDHYRFVHASCLPREQFERWPSLPVFRGEAYYEEATFLPAFLRNFEPERHDVVVTCTYPFLNWAVRLRRLTKRRPVTVFVTQNGDWPLQRKNWEYLLFDCDALVCINPDYFDQHGTRWPTRLIPNGVDVDMFSLGPPEREKFGLPENGKVVLIVSALIESKRVLEGIEAVALLPDVHLLIAGDGPLRGRVDELGRAKLGARFHRAHVKRADMPALYRSADLLLHMSLDEPFGNVYVEAMASGIPIVTHDRRITRWMLEPHATFVDATDLPAVAGAIRQTLDHSFDPERASLAAREKFSWSSIAAKYGAFFRELTAARNGNGG